MEIGPLNLIFLAVYLPLHEVKSCIKFLQFSILLAKSTTARRQLVLDDISPNRRHCRGFRLQSQIAELGTLSCKFRRCRPQRRDYAYLLSWSYVSRRNWVILSRQTTVFCPLHPFWFHWYGKHLHGFREKKNNRKNRVTFKHCSKIIWACFGQYKVLHQ